jgi:hypothetical protein
LEPNSLFAPSIREMEPPTRQLCLEYSVTVAQDHRNAVIKNYRVGQLVQSNLSTEKAIANLIAMAMSRKGRLAACLRKTNRIKEADVVKFGIIVHGLDRMLIRRPGAGALTIVENWASQPPGDKVVDLLEDIKAAADSGILVILDIQHVDYKGLAS